MLYKLLANMDRSRFESSVVSLRDCGPVGDRIQELGIPVYPCEMRTDRPDFGAFRKLVRRLQAEKPDIVQTWMYHSDLFGGIATRFAGKPRLVWNIRHTRLDPVSIRKSTIMIGKACSKLSGRLPDRILCCSEAAHRDHLSLGFNANKMQVVPNGFVLSEFKPHPEQRAVMRKQLDIPAGAKVIGHAGRFHAMKNHEGFIKAAKIASAECPDLYFVMCGDDVTWENIDLSKWIREAGLEPRFRLLGRRSDMPSVYSSMDIATLCSIYGEGFPNVVGEAMACSVPCVVTDVGESSVIVGNTGLCVPPGDTAALSRAWLNLVNRGGEELSVLGQCTRERIDSMFEIGAVARQYETVYTELLDGRR